MRRLSGIIQVNPKCNPMCLTRERKKINYSVENDIKAEKGLKMLLVLKMEEDFKSQRMEGMQL